LTLERPAVGSRVLIPAAFQAFRDPSSAAERAERHNISAQETRLTTVYQTSRREWIGLSQGGTISLRFDPPQGLAPLEVQRLKVTLDIVAPDRQVEVFVVREGERHSLGERKGPLGQQEYRYTAGTAWRLEASRTIDLDVRISAPPQNDSNTQWKIRGIGLATAAVVAPD